jgi:transketolase
MNEMADNVRRNILLMTHRAGAAHVGSSLSMVEIALCSYLHAIRTSSGSNVFTSKGHAAAAVYAVLAELEIIEKSELLNYCADGSLFSGHVSHYQVNGVPLSTGSLGHALPVAAGVALANKIDNSKDETLVILSDGECDEGSNWEAAMFAAHFELSNLKVIIDRNGLQSIGSTEDTIRLEPLDEKWKSFGWSVLEVDGHSQEQISEALLWKPAKGRGPTAIIASTTKGKGVKFMEGSNVWHYRPPSDVDLEKALMQISDSN